MKIAVVTNDGKTISKHFAQADQYVVVAVENGQVVTREIRQKMDQQGLNRDKFGDEPNNGYDQQRDSGTGGQNHPVAPMWATIADCEVVLSRGMSIGMYDNLKHAGIQPILTLVADIDRAVMAYLEGRLKAHPDWLWVIK